MGLEMNMVVGYFSIGFAPTGVQHMKELDLVAFTFNLDGTTGNYTVSTEDYYSSETGYPPTDISLGGTSDYKLTDFYVGNGKTQVQFERLLKTGDKYDYQFDQADAATNGLSVSWAWFPAKGTTNALAYHQDNRGVITQTLLANGQDIIPAPASTWNYYSIHKYGMLIVWGLLIEVAIQAGRYQKHSKHGIDLHRIIATLIYLFTALSSANMLKLSKFPSLFLIVDTYYIIS